MKPGALPVVLRVIHVVIISNFVLQVGYGAYMVFAVVTPGGSGPLFGQATSVPHELMMTRRAYALETWVAISGLALYLAVTEILPRRLQPTRPEAER